MRDLRKYWEQIRAIERELPEFVWMTSVEDPHEPACLVEVQAARAAQLLHAKSHRLATQEEIQARQAREAIESRRNFHERLRRKGIAIVPV